MAFFYHASEKSPINFEISVAIKNVHVKSIPQISQIYSEQKQYLLLVTEYEIYWNVKFIGL